MPKCPCGADIPIDPAAKCQLALCDACIKAAAEEFWRIYREEQEAKQRG